MRSYFAVTAVLVLVTGLAFSQNSADVLGVHNLSPGSGSSIYLTSGNTGCTYCHAPHNGMGSKTPLWNQKLSKATYTPYTSTTYHQTGNTQPPLGTSSNLCLSCHDGTVAVGQSTAFGNVSMTGSWQSGDSFGVNLTGSHPFSLITPIKDASHLQASIVSQGTTADPLHKVNLINGNVECTSCHDPHVQATDTVAQNFLVRDSSSGQMCLACHDPNRVVQGQTNPLAQWANSIHKSATNTPSTSARVGSYASVAQNACSSCHVDHNAGSPGRLLRPANPATPGMDAVTQPCVTCHNGGTYLSPAAPNVMSEFAKVGHPLPSGNNNHDAAEPGVLMNNRHATCVDCHDAHGSAQVTNFVAPPTMRVSQSGTSGVSASDGTTVLSPAINQYETCLRCHGTGPGKQTLAVYGYAPMRLVAMPDALNVIPEFSATATSSHPVFHDRTSSLPQPSLRTNMLNLNGTDSTRPTGPRIFCSDCHNSDDNREFGGTGPNGPHGSANSHMLERNYQFSQAAVAGGNVTNRFPNPSLAVNGPYALCSKCHDLTKVLSSASWSRHNLHVSELGFSCSVCHTAHGMGSNSPSVSGERLVNFDVKVVAQNGSTPISYNRATGSCTLTCHGERHGAGSGNAVPLAPARAK